jgi:hypothetical protein
MNVHNVHWSFGIWFFDVPWRSPTFAEAEKTLPDATVSFGNTKLARSQARSRIDISFKGWWSGSDFQQQNL